MLSRQGRFKLFWKVIELSMARHSILLFEIGKSLLKMNTTYIFKQKTLNCSIWDKSMKRNRTNSSECKIVGYKFRSSPQVTFGASHFIQEDDQLFFGPFYGTYQR